MKYVLVTLILITIQLTSCNSEAKSRNNYGGYSEFRLENLQKVCYDGIIYLYYASGRRASLSPKIDRNTLMPQKCYK